MVEVVELTNNALLSRICKRLRKSAVSVLGGFLLAELSQLTLFPSGYLSQETSSWEQRKFSELASLRRGLTYSPADICPYGQGVRVLRSSNIAEDEFVLSREDVFVDEDAVKIDLAQDDEILITAANGSPRLVGKRAKIHD